MHRELLGFPSTKVDHVDGDGLNNQRSNIRLATNPQNGMNRRVSQNNKSGFKGVSPPSCRSMWRSYIAAGEDQKNIYLGTYDTPEEAALAYMFAAILYFGEFARA